jgi:hypothetical protein
VLRRIAFVVPSLLALVLLAGSAQAKAGHPAKPSIKLTGISVNDQNFTPGTKVTLKAPINACYGIGGADQSPPDVTMFAFVHAVKVPNKAPLTTTFVTPWDTQTLPDTADPHPTFGSSWFHNRGHQQASIFGGADGPDDFFRYDDEGTGRNIFNGTYTVSVSVKVSGKVLRTHGSITIDCE